MWLCAAARGYTVRLPPIPGMRVYAGYFSENPDSPKLVNRAALGPLSWFLLGQITYLPNAYPER